MAEIVQVFTIVRILLAPDYMPWSDLLAPSNLARLQESYKFQQIGSPDVTQLRANTLPKLIASGGEYSLPDRVIPIQQLQLEPNAIEFQISAPSDDAQPFFDSLIEFFAGVRADGQPMKEYTRTVQTIAVAKLDVPFEAMFSKEMLEYLSGQVKPSLDRDDARAELRLGHLSWRVTYRSETADFSYLPKSFTLEPRVNSNPADQLYYTASPAELRVHKELLERFEKMLATNRDTRVSSEYVRPRHTKNRKKAVS